MPDIVRTDDVLGGEPRIEGTRVSVLDIYELVVGGETPVEVADQVDSSLAEVYTALAYYYDNPEEMRRLEQEQAATESKLRDDALEPPELAK